MRLYYRKRATGTEKYNGIDFIVVPDMKGSGLSLGNTVFVKYGRETYLNLWKHEYGHCKQSLYLGWFYLLVIGLPSLIWAWQYKAIQGSYYRFYTERWADRLGGVER